MEVEPMNVRYSGLVLLGLVLLAVSWAPVAQAAEWTARLTADPKPVGPDIAVSGFVFEGASLATADLVVRNTSTNLLTIDVARSTVIVGAGDARPLGTLLGSGFVAALLPGAQTSDTLDILAPVELGDQLTLHLVWTLGAIVNSATWVWEIVDPAAPAAPVTPQPPPSRPVPAKPVPTQPAPAAPDATPATDSAGSGVLLGLLGLLAGLALVGLIAWGIWALTQ
jgi:hypothetical protein